MDDTDLQIIRALLVNPLASVASVARDTRLGDSATRGRIKRLREEGTLGDVAAIPNGRLVGGRYVTALYSSGDWREMLQLPSVVGASVNHEGVVAPTCLIPDGSTWEVPPDLTDAYGPPERTFVQTDSPLVPAGPALSSVQWRILVAMVANPTASDRDLAASSGLGARAVKRHREAFVRGHHVRLELSVRSLRGDHILFHLFVAGPGSQNSSVRDALAQQLGGAWPQHELETPKGVLFFCAANNLAQAAAAPRIARGLPGVEHAELVISVDGAYDTGKLVAACHGAAQAAASPAL